MNLQEAIEHPFQDDKWVSKAIIGSIVALFAFPFFFIAMPILYGWGLHVARKVAKGDQTELPEWSYIGTFFLDGFKLWLARLIWMVPFYLIVVGLSLGPLLIDETTLGSSWPLVFLFIFPFAILPIAIVTFAFPLQFGLAAETNSFLEVVNPLRVIRYVREHPKPSFYAWLISFGAQAILGSVGYMLCCVGWFPATVYMHTIWGHAFGQVLRLKQEQVA